MNLNLDNLLSRFSPCLRDNISELLNIKLGVADMNISLVPRRNERLHDAYCNNFVVKLPLAGKLLEWEVVFNEDDYEFAPDFFFQDEYFLADPTDDVLLKNVPSLLEWNLHNSKSFKLVVCEFLNLYKRFQIERLSQDDTFYSLYEQYELLKNSGIAETDMEICIDDSGVTFLIQLRIDISLIFGYMERYHRGSENDSSGIPQEKILLKIYFSRTNRRITTHLQQSVLSEAMIGTVSKLKLPAYNRDNSLLEYVQEVTNHLNMRVNTIENHHKMKNRYLCALSSARRHSIVEYDNDKFYKLSMLCEVDKFCCLVGINITPKFPAEKPQVTLSSLYTLHFDKPYACTVDYPYDPEWTPEAMVKKLFEELQIIVPKFKMDSSTVNKQ